MTTFQVYPYLKYQILLLIVEKLENSSDEEKKVTTSTNCEESCIKDYRIFLERIL